MIKNHIPGLKPNTFSAKLKAILLTNKVTIKYAITHLNGQYNRQTSIGIPLGTAKIKGIIKLIIKLIKKAIGFHNNCL